MLYHSIFHSRTEYGLVFWGNAANSISGSILILQKSAIRLLSGRDRLHHSFPLFKNSNILSLKHIYYYKVLKIFFAKIGNLNSELRGKYLLRARIMRVMPFLLLRASSYRNWFAIVLIRLYNRLSGSLLQGN